MIGSPPDTYLIQLVLIKNVCTQEGMSCASEASNLSSTYSSAFAWSFSLLPSGCL